MPIIDIDILQNIAKNLDYKSTLDNLGISIKDDNGNFKSTYQILKELSDLRTQKEEELETLTNRWMELEEKKEG